MVFGLQAKYNNFLKKLLTKPPQLRKSCGGNLKEGGKVVILIEDITDF